MASIFGLVSSSISWSGEVLTYPASSSITINFVPPLPDEDLKIRVSHPRHIFTVTSASITPSSATVVWAADNYEKVVNRQYDHEYKPYFSVYSGDTLLTSFDHTGTLYHGSIESGNLITQSMLTGPTVAHFPLTADLVDTTPRAQSLVPAGTFAFAEDSARSTANASTLTLQTPGHDWRDFSAAFYLKGCPGLSKLSLGGGLSYASAELDSNIIASSSVGFVDNVSQMVPSGVWTHFVISQETTSFEANIEIYADQMLLHSRTIGQQTDPDFKRISLYYPLVATLDDQAALAHLSIYPYALDAAGRLAHAQSWPGYVPPAALVLHLPLSADYIALVGTTPAGVPPASGSFASGYLNMDTAYSFETSSDTFAATNGFTMCAWMRSAVGWQPGDYINIRVFEGNFTSNSKAELYLESDHVWGRHEQVTGLSAGQWYHLAWRWRPSDNLQELLVDGVVSASSIQPGQITTYQSWRVQNNAVGAAIMHLQVWDGYVDDIAQLMLDYPLPEIGMHWPLTSDLSEANGGIENLAVESGTTSYADGGLYIDTTSKIGVNLASTISTDFTIMFVGKGPGVGSIRIKLNDVDAATESLLFTQELAGNRLTTHFFNPGQIWFDHKNTTLTDTVWEHCAWVFNNTASTVRTFLNGVFLGEYALPSQTSVDFIQRIEFDVISAGSYIKNVRYLPSIAPDGDVAAYAASDT